MHHCCSKCFFFSFSSVSSIRYQISLVSFLLSSLHSPLPWPHQMRKNNQQRYQQQQHNKQNDIENLSLIAQSGPLSHFTFALTHSLTHSFIHSTMFFLYVCIFSTLFAPFHVSILAMSHIFFISSCTPHTPGNTPLLRSVDDPHPEDTRLVPGI